jgi:hypothetical protein
MLGAVILIEGYDPVAGAPVSLYAGSHDDADVCHLNGWTWWPAIAKLPTLRYDLFDGAFAGQIAAPSSSLTLRTEPWPNLGRYQLADARLRLWTGEVGAAWATWTLRFDGRLTGQPTLQDGVADFAFAVDDRWLDKALLGTYAGTTGIEGPAALKGQVKPLALGAPRYAAGTLIDSVANIFQVSAFGIAGVEAALERLARFGPAQGDYATYAALVAAVLPAGTWATCLAYGLVRFGAPPAGQVSFLLQGDSAGAEGWVRRPGRIIRRLATIAGGAGRTDDASLNALDAARPYNLSIYLDQQTTAREVIQSIAASLNCVAGVSWTGQLFIAPVAIGAADVVLAADGSSLPPVQSVQQLEIAAPFQKLAMAAERAWTVHALDEIAFTATLVDVGTYNPATTYREGNVVTLASGARYLYINAAPSAGNAPPTAAYWSQLAAAAIVDYANVTGATRPEDNATLGATLGANAAAGNVKKRVGGLWLESDLQTAVGISAGFNGQGPFSTIASVGYGSSLLTGFNVFATLASIAFGSSYLLTSTGTAATDALYQTGLGIASGFFGQGALATLNAADYATRVTGAGKPELYATRGDNLVPDPLMADLHGACECGRSGARLCHLCQRRWRPPRRQRITELRPHRRRRSPRAFLRDGLPRQHRRRVRGCQSGMLHGLRGQHGQRLCATHSQGRWAVDGGCRLGDRAGRYGKREGVLRSPDHQCRRGDDGHIGHRHPHCDDGAGCDARRGYRAQYFRRWRPGGALRTADRARCCLRVRRAGRLRDRQLGRLWLGAADRLWRAGTARLGCLRVELPEDVDRHRCHGRAVSDGPRHCVRLLGAGALGHLQRNTAGEAGGDRRRSRRQLAGPGGHEFGLYDQGQQRGQERDRLDGHRLLPFAAHRSCPRLFSRGVRRGCILVQRRLRCRSDNRPDCRLGRLRHLGRGRVHGCERELLSRQREWPVQQYVDALSDGRRRDPGLSGRLDRHLPDDRGRRDHHDRHLDGRPRSPVLLQGQAVFFGRRAEGDTGQQPE